MHLNSYLFIETQVIGIPAEGLYILSFRLSGVKTIIVLIEIMRVLVESVKLHAHCYTSKDDG